MYFDMCVLYFADIHTHYLRILFKHAAELINVNFEMNSFIALNAFLREFVLFLDFFPLVFTLPKILKQNRV